MALARRKPFSAEWSHSIWGKKFLDDGSSVFRNAGCTAIRLRWPAGYNGPLGCNDPVVGERILPCRKQERRPPS